MELLPAGSMPSALALMREVGGAPSIGPAELAELRGIGPAVALGERDGDRVVAMVLCGRSPVGADVFGIVWLGVHPSARGRGLGSALLAAAETRARAGGAERLVLGGRPGGYLVPGIEASRTEERAWLRKRGFVERGEAADLRVVLDASLTERARERSRALSRDLLGEGYLLARASPGDPRVATWVGRHFGRGWRHEVTVALARRPAAVHVALRLDRAVARAGGLSGSPIRATSERLVGFAAHSARLAGLGTFGPTGVLPRARGKGIGEALLWRCLLDLARDGHDEATIAWVGPRAWYAEICGARVEREYVTMVKPLGA